MGVATPKHILLCADFGHLPEQRPSFHYSTLLPFFAPTERSRQIWDARHLRQLPRVEHQGKKIRHGLTRHPSGTCANLSRRACGAGPGAQLAGYTAVGTNVTAIILHPRCHEKITKSHRIKREKNHENHYHSPSTRGTIKCKHNLNGNNIGKPKIPSCCQDYKRSR